MRINRRELVARHNPRLRAFDFFSPLSVGNGEFAFTADATGLQTFVDDRPGTMPLCAQAQWAWHSFPPADGEYREFSRLRLQAYDAGERSVGYATDPGGQEALFDGLRINPHRLDLARLGFVFNADRGTSDSASAAAEFPADACPFRAWTAAAAAEFQVIDQDLDLWTGRLDSRFTHHGRAFKVSTVCHPQQDAIAIRAETLATSETEIAILLAFPYASPQLSAADWTAPTRHRTTVAGESERGRIRLLRVFDDTAYHVDVAVKAPGRIDRVGDHYFMMRGTGALEIVVRFSPSPSRAELPEFETCRREAERHWAEFWSSGGVVETAGSADPRGQELERRIVLSQYLTAIQCAGSLPPQETGLSGNSWFGKFHLEMHYWHAAHFPLWGRPALLERSLWYYRAIMPSARERARTQGYEGVRWPKMTDPSGADSPSWIGPLLCWQQPHPIMYAELLYRGRPELETLHAYADIVFSSADFMVSYLRRLEDGFRHLASPVIPAQENHDPRITIDPCFEVAYWRWGLAAAINWRRRLGLPVSELWSRSLNELVALPIGTLADGRRVYLSHAACPDSFGAFAKDHPSMLAALGVLNGAGVDAAIMSATYDAVMESWDFDSAWGWDFPMIAMTAARLGRRKDAVDALLLPAPKNLYRANGHNPQLPRPDLPLYLPGNGGLLLAIALMTAGWDGEVVRPATAGQATVQTAGFPDDGSWTVAWEGLSPLP